MVTSPMRGGRKRKIGDSRSGQRRPGPSTYQGRTMVAASPEARIGGDHVDAGGGARFRAGAHQAADGEAAAQQLRGQPAAHESAGAGDEDGAGRHYWSLKSFCRRFRLPLISSVASWIWETS